MLNEQNKELCKKVLEKYGVPHQLLKLGEECTELAQVIFRVAQGETNEENMCNLIEEFIDVRVMQEELTTYFQERMESFNEMLNEGAAMKLKRALEEENEVD